MVIRLGVLCFCWFGILCQAEDDPVPLVRAHAHNDYYHSRPLLDALDDVWGGAHILLRRAAVLLLPAAQARSLRRREAELRAGRLRI